MEIIDATGLYALPAGIDTVGGYATVTDFVTSGAATTTLAGGTGTVGLKFKLNEK
jgi:hypothetical protein